MPRLSLRNLYPKDLLVYFHAPGRKLVELAIRAKVAPEPGILASIAKMLAESNVRILGVNFTVREDERYILIFADITSATLPLDEILKRISSQDFVLEIRHQEGVIEGYIFDAFGYPPTIGRGKVRTVVFPLEALAGMRARLMEKLGSGGAAILYHEGYLLGLQIGKMLAGDIRRESLLTEVCIRLYQALGWGLMNISKIDTLAGEVVLRIEDNFEVIHREGKADEPVCHFTRGVLVGFFEGLWGKKVEVIEAKCKATGDPYCEFIISFPPG